MLPENMMVIGGVARGVLEHIMWLMGFIKGTFISPAMLRKYVFPLA